MDRNMIIDIDVIRGGLRGAPNGECGYTSILLDITHHAGPQAQVHLYLRGGNPDHDGSVASTPKLRKSQPTTTL